MAGDQKLRHFELCAGIGGFSLGLERSGLSETTGFVEIDPFCRRVLAKHWPDVPQMDNVHRLTALLKRRLRRTSGRPDFHARISQSQASEPVSLEAARACGPKYGEPLAWLDHASSSWRTWQISLVETEAHGSERYWGTWPRSGMMQNGIAYQLPSLAPLTGGIGSGLWPTPNASNGFAPFSMETMKRKERGEARPSGAVMGFDLKWERRCVPYLVDGWINPTLSEWLMGYPYGHTDCELLATRSSRKRRKCWD